MKLSEKSKPLKDQNTLLLLGVMAADALLLITLTLPSISADVAKFSSLLVRLLTLAGAPALVLMATMLIPAEGKSAIVFLRIRNILPGHRAFSTYVPRDGRIDAQALRKNVGAFPSDPKEQNKLWYRLYKKVEAEISVTQAHRHYLLFRDLAALSLLLALVSPAVLLFVGLEPSLAAISIGLFIVQYVLSAIAARNSGVGFVCNVLALHSVKRR